MKRISVILFALTFLGCTPGIPSPAQLPASTSGSVLSLTSEPTHSLALTLTLEPTQTILPTATPFLDVLKLTTLSTFNAITAVTSPENVTDVWAVGNNGVIVAYRPSRGESSFVQMEAPESADWYDIDFVSPADGWIVGGGDVILHWAGESWEVSKPATVDPWAQFYSYGLTTVAFSEANDGWAAGCVNSEGGQQILIYHWDGITWSRTSLPDELSFWVCIHDVAALAPNDVWMVGTGWNGTESGVALHWNGAVWEAFAEGEAFTNHSISALSSDDIWAITAQGVVWHWDGVNWTESARLDSANLIHARKPDDIVAMGDKLWHRTGSTWAEIDLTKDIFPVDPDIIDFIEVPNGRSSDLWLLDSSGVIYKVGLYWLDFKT